MASKTMSYNITSSIWSKPTYSYKNIWFRSLTVASVCQCPQVLVLDSYMASKVRIYCQRITSLTHYWLFYIGTASWATKKPTVRLSIGGTQKVEKSGVVGYSRIFEVDVHESPVLLWEVTTYLSRRKEPPGFLCHFLCFSK